MLPLSSTPTVVNTVVFSLAGILPPANPPIVISQAVNRAATY